jgi:hypothetical protein
VLLRESLSQLIVRKEERHSCQEGNTRDIVVRKETQETQLSGRKHERHSWEEIF